MNQKPLALLIPGLDGTGRFFDGHIQALSARFRPMPWAYRRRKSFDFSDLVEDLAEATADEAPGSIRVVGDSFGGPVALNFVLAYPKRVGRLILINTFCRFDWRIRIRLGCRLAPSLRWYGIRKVKDLVSDAILSLEGIPPEERRQYHRVVSMIDFDAYCRRLELVRDVDLRGRLTEISVPTLILAAARDKIVPSISSSRFMAGHIPDSQILEFPRAGHALLLTPGFSLADYL